MLIDSGTFTMNLKSGSGSNLITFNADFQNPPVVVCSLNDTGPNGSTRSYLSAMAKDVNENNFNAAVNPIWDTNPPDVKVDFNWIAVEA